MAVIESQEECGIESYTSHFLAVPWQSLFKLYHDSQYRVDHDLLPARQGGIGKQSVSVMVFAMRRSFEMEVLLNWKSSEVD